MVEVVHESVITLKILDINFFIYLLICLMVKFKGLKESHELHACIEHFKLSSFSKSDVVGRENYQIKKMVRSQRVRGETRGQVNKR